MKISRMSRRNAAAKRMDLSDIKSALADNAIRVAIGVVRSTNESEKHYEVVMDGSTVFDVLVDVELMPSSADVTCRLGTMAGGAGGGLWRIPAEGTEVMVVVPQLDEGGDDLSWMPTIVAVLSTGNVPARVADNRTILVAPDRVEIIAPLVYLSSDGTTGEPLITKSQFDNHFHSTGTGPSSNPNNAATSGTTVVRGQ